MKHDLLPPNVIALVRHEAECLEFGSVRLEIFLRDGKPRRWEISKSISIIDESVPKSIDGNFPKKEEVA